MKMRWVILLFAVFCVKFSFGLVYPLSSADVIDPGTALIPCLPRPMYTYDDSPFRWFGASESYARVSFIADLPKPSAEETELTEMIEKLYLVSFVSDSDLERSAIFDAGLRFAPISIISKDICSTDSTEAITQSISPTISTFQKTVFQYDSNKDGSYTLYSKLGIKKTGFQYVFIINCNNREVFQVKIISGRFVFRNPHGYLPGGWYLKLPFAGSISFGYLFYMVLYAATCVLYREHTMYVQYAVIALLFIGLVEQSSYYFTFLKMNLIGDLPCCPVRTDMGFCLIISAVKRAVLVIFLLAVSLGYGIQRPTLLKREILSVTVIGLLYMFAAVNYEISLIEEVDSLTDNEEETTGMSQLVSSMLLSLLNMVAVSWIYFSILSVIHQLKEENQIAKKKMYEKLARALVLWFVVGFIAEVIFYVILSDAVSMPWKYDMVPKFIWDLLFFLVVLQIGILWYPNSKTSQYAYSMQLPTSDFEEFDNVGSEFDGADNVEMYGKNKGFDKIQVDDPVGEFEIGDEEDDFDKFDESDSENSSK